MSKISLLPAAAALSGTEIFPFLQGGANVRDTLNNIKAFITAGIANTGTAGEIKIVGSVISFDGTIAASKTEAKIKGSVGATAGLIPFGTGTADELSTVSGFVFSAANLRLAIGNVITPAHLTLGGSSATQSSLKIVSGSAPTAPQDGDIWYDGTDLKMRVGGTTKTFTLT